MPTIYTRSDALDLNHMSLFELTQERDAAQAHYERLKDASPMLELDVLRAKKQCELFREEISRREGLCEPMPNYGFSDLPDEYEADD